MCDMWYAWLHLSGHRIRFRFVCSCQTSFIMWCISHLWYKQSLSHGYILKSARKKTIHLSHAYSRHSVRVWPKYFCLRCLCCIYMTNIFKVIIIYQIIYILSIPRLFSPMLYSSGMVMTLKRGRKNIYF